MPPRSSLQPRLACVAIVGAPNVGKSTLFNRLVGRRRAIVTDRPGITRDRIHGIVQTGNGTFALCDTGGLRPGEAGTLAEQVLRQTEEAIGEADVLLFVVDGRTGLTPLDQELARNLRRRGKPIVLAVNKIDTPARVHLAAEYHGLGLGEPLALSAEQGLGMPELLDALENALGPLPEAPQAAAEETVVAIVGRPNVGKSSLLNRILGQERVTVNEQPGTTRDSIDTVVERNGCTYRFVDTAGIRRKGKTKDLAEVLSVVAARRSLESADVVLLVLDASEPIAAQDQTVAGYATRSRRPLILVGNKWDLVEEPETATAALRREIGRRFRFASYAPLITVSALSGLRVDRILPLVDTVDHASRKRISTAELNRFLQGEASGGRGPKLLYMTQTGVRPPTFLIFARDASRVHFSTRRRLENRLRERFGFGPTPLVLRIRSRGKGRS